MGIYTSAIPLADVKAFLGVTHTDADAWLEREIESQLQAIEIYLDRPVVVRQFREDLDGTGDSQLVLNHAPVQSVLSLNIDLDRKFAISTQIAADRYFISHEDRIEMEYDAFYCGRQNVRIAYIAGFAEIEIPFARQRFDFRETQDGRPITVYIPAGIYTPDEIAETLQPLINAVVSDKSCTVTFDWVSRTFQVEVSQGYFEVLTAFPSIFESAESVTGLIGWASDTAVDPDNEVKSGVVAFQIPEVITLVALESIAEQYQRGSFGQNRYGTLRAYRLDDYQVTYNSEGSGSGQTTKSSSLSEKHTGLLNPLRRWTLI